MNRIHFWLLGLTTGAIALIAYLTCDIPAGSQNTIQTQDGQVAYREQQGNHARPALDELRRRARARTLPHLDWADQESQRQIAGYIAFVDAFFEDMKQRTPQFAESVLGWESKWAVLADHLPFGEGGRHEAFLRQAFRDHLFTPEQLEQLTRQVVQGYIDSLSYMEGVMLVKIRQDIGDLAPGHALVVPDPKTLEQLYAQIVAKVTETADSSLRNDLARGTVSLIVGEVFTQVALEMGASCSILGAGAATAPETLGVGLFVGLIVDQIVSCLWAWWADPQRDLVLWLNGKLDEMHGFIVEGTAQSPGLNQRLEQYGRERARVRRAVVLKMIEESRCE